MNVERILALADIIEVQPHVPDEADIGFNMGSYTHSCGSPPCIAGWAASEASIAGVDIKEPIWKIAGNWLGIDDTIEDELFECCNTLHEDIILSEITPAQAATTLRNLAATGIVDWSHVNAEAGK